MSLEKKLGVTFVGMLFVMFCCVLTMRLTRDNSDQKVDISFGAENSATETPLVPPSAKPTLLAEQSSGDQSAFPAAQPRKFANSTPGDIPPPGTPPPSEYASSAVLHPPHSGGHAAPNAGSGAMPGNTSPLASSPFRAAQPSGDNRYATTAPMTDSRYATPAVGTHAIGSGARPPMSSPASSSVAGSSTRIDVAEAPRTSAPLPSETALARPTAPSAPTVAATTMTGENPLRSPSTSSEFAASQPAATSQTNALPQSSGFATPNITAPPLEPLAMSPPTSAAASRYPSSTAERASSVASPSTSPSVLPGVAALTPPASAPGLAPSVAAHPLPSATAASPVATVSASIPVASSGKDQPYVVAPGDTLYGISQKVYGEGAYYRALFAYNSDRYPHAEDIRAGNVLDVPPLEYLKGRYPELTSGAADPAGQSFGSRASTSGGTYVVREGDTLFDIARRQLGQASRWTELYNLNRSALGENLENLRPGIELKLP